MVLLHVCCVLCVFLITVDELINVSVYYLFFQVRIKYSEQYEYEQISNLLGMDKKDGFSVGKSDKEVSILPAL